MRDIEKMIAEGNQAACDSRHDATAGEFMAIADGITDNVNGFTEEDDEAAFARRIHSLQADRDLLRSVGQGAFRDLYNTWDSLVDDVYANYQRIIDNHKSSKQ